MSEHHHRGHFDHDHSHPPPRIDDVVRSYHQILGIALKELLIEKGVVTASELRDMIQKRETMSPANGAHIVARAWTDPSYRARLLSDGNEAIAALGYPMHTARLVALENTRDVHHVVVCTLCSCYPRELLGLPPAWYKSRSYRSRMVREPRAVLAEFGTELPEHVEVRVHDSTADVRFLVLPQRPAETDDLSEGELAALVSRDAMIGVVR